MFGVRVFLYLKNSFLHHICGTNLVPFLNINWWHPRLIFNRLLVRICFIYLLVINLCVRERVAIPFGYPTHRVRPTHRFPPHIAPPTLRSRTHKISIHISIVFEPILLRYWMFVLLQHIYLIGSTLDPEYNI